MMKNAFISPQKLFLFLRYLIFLSWLFNHIAKQLDLKDEVNLKFYDVTAWLINNCIHILSNISRSKGNQTMKFGQLIEYNMESIFLEKSYTKCGGKTFPRPFSGKLKSTISQDQ